VEGAVDRGAFAGRDDHAHGKGRRGCQWLLMSEWEKRGEEMGRGMWGGQGQRRRQRGAREEMRGGLESGGGQRGRPATPDNGPAVACAGGAAVSE
jgi:hypothetical protein